MRAAPHAGLVRVGEARGRRGVHGDVAAAPRPLDRRRAEVELLHPHACWHVRRCMHVAMSDVMR